jgi:uncharacterized integral membrane protein
MIRFFKFVILVLLTLIVAVFAANNNQAVAIDLYPMPMKFEVSLFVIVFSAIIIGVVLSGTITSIKLLYWRRVARSAQEQLKKLEKEHKNSRQNSHTEFSHRLLEQDI